MATPAQSYFTALTRLVGDVLDAINLERLDINPDRALWEVHGMSGHYHMMKMSLLDGITIRIDRYYVKNTDVTSTNTCLNQSLINTDFGKQPLN